LATSALSGQKTVDFGPRDIVDGLHREPAKALANPAVKESLGKLGAEQNLMNPRLRFGDQE